MRIPVSKKYENNKLVFDFVEVEESNIAAVVKATAENSFMPVFGIKLKDGTEVILPLELAQDFLAVHSQEAIQVIDKINNLIPKNVPLS